ncbi:hypothetical protein PIB30_084230 [Stylosanthes scabra]|uniref:Uncharacterized protein n=1 Tax=Stylosanthes scabra TaxID=79078 RepID=A0ABU6YUC2_9FABA|nr:hypothetical protein [Stylosanthes scabra]
MKSFRQTHRWLRPRHVVDTITHTRPELRHHRLKPLSVATLDAHDFLRSSEVYAGTVLEDLHFELDEWSLQEIVNELKKLGYKGYTKFWYVHRDAN